MTITIDGEVIPEQAVHFELERLVRFYSEHMSPDQIREQMDALRERARDQAIGAKLLMREAERLNFKVPESDVDERMEEMVQNCGGDEGFQAQLAQQGLTVAMVREGIARGRKIDLLVAKITQNVPDPSEADLVAHFEAHKEEYARADRAAAQHILIQASSDSEADRATATSRLQEIRAQILDGKDFSEMAAVHSECPSGKRAGGSLGWFSRGMMLPEFDQVVFDMEVDELSDVVQSPAGFHIIRKLGHEPGGPASFDDAHDQVRDFLRHVNRGEMISGYVNELKAKCRIEIKD